MFGANRGPQMKKRSAVTGTDSAKMVAERVQISFDSDIDAADPSVLLPSGRQIARARIECIGALATFSCIRPHVGDFHNWNGCEANFKLGPFSFFVPVFIFNSAVGHMIHL